MESESLLTQEAQRATYRAPVYNVQPSRKSLSNSDARVAFLFHRSAQKTQT